MLRGRLRIPMRARSVDEPHRAATPLELFFDLVFVVAIAAAASGLHHAIADGRAPVGMLHYAMVFFAIWWAWMNFTWFASAYDTDDAPYRLVVLVQLTGALILAAGVPPAFEGRDFAVVTAGYVVMRMAMVAHWLRAAGADPPRRPCALRYAIGVSVLQVAWVGLLFVPERWGLPGFVGLALGELAVPVWAERAAPTTWHPRHIAERYGLLMIIVLGESILAASIAIRSAIDAGEPTLDLVPIIAGGLLIVFSLWWLYFRRPAHPLLTSFRRAFLWGYGHYALYASGAAVGAGIAVAVDEATRHAAIGSVGAGAAVAVPVAVFLLCLWLLHERPRAEGPLEHLLDPVTALLVLLAPLTGQAALVTGSVLASLLGLKLFREHRAAAG